MGQPVVHFEVIGKDASATQRFYSELFGWEYAPSPAEGYKLVDVDTTEEGAGIGGGVGGAINGGDGYVTFYVEVPDINEALQKAERLGGKRAFGPEEVPGVGIQIAQFNDPDGHLIGLVTPG